MLFNDRVKNILFDIWERHSVLDWDEIKTKTHDAGELAVEIINFYNEDQFEKIDLLEHLDRDVKFVEKNIRLYHLSGDELKASATELREAFEDACIKCIDRKIGIQQQIECVLNTYILDLNQCRKEECRCSAYENHYL